MLRDRQARRAALVLACAAGGAQLAAAAADAWFLAAIGPRHLGTALAASSLLVALTLALVGAVSDRRDRRRTLVALCAAAAVVLPALDLAHRLGAEAAAVASMIVVKQLQAAVDLAFWVAIAERFDARAARRLVPWLTAAGGVGAVVGAALVVPLARLGGASLALGAGAGLMAVAAVGATRLDPARRLGAAPSPGGSMRWGGGWDQLRRQPLARGLAVVVALGGAFASLAYFVLGAEAASRYADSAALAQFLGAVRAVSQAAMLIVQLAIAPRLIARAGVGGALVVAPLGAALSAAASALLGGLPAATAVQAQARVLDGAVDAPAQKLAQNLLPAEIRGRVGGFLDGVAKRAGAVAGGLGATALLPWPEALRGALVAVAAAWAAGALLVRARLPRWALAAVGAGGGGEGAADEVVLGDRAARRLVADLERADPARAAELAARLHRAGAIDARPVIAGLLARAPAGEARAVASALWACARGRDPATARAAAAALPRLPDEAAEWVARAAGVLGRGAGLALEGAAVGARGGRRAAVVEVALAVARARVAEQADAVDEVVTRALDDDDPEVQAVGLRELAVEVGLAAAAALPESGGRTAGAADDEPLPSTSLLSMRPAAGVASYRAQRLPGAAVAPAVAAPSARAFELGRRLLRLARRGQLGTAVDRARAVVALGELAAVARAIDSAEAVLFRREAYELCRRLADRRHEPAPPPVATAALAALGSWRPMAAEDVHLLADALGDRDDDVRDAATAVLRGLGAEAAADLARAAGFGRRAARDRALALLRELPVTTPLLDRLVAAELDALDAAVLRAAALATLHDPWIRRRLGERLDEIGHTALLLIAARERSADIAAGARLFRHARGKDERGRALEALDAALPRAVAVRLLPPLDGGELVARTRAARERLRAEPPPREAAIRAELTGADPLLRHLLVRALGAERARYRAALADAARAAAAEVSPLDLLRRITEPDDDDGDVPAAVEKMVLLASLPLLAGVTTPQIAALAERAQVVDLAAGQVLQAEGELLDALVLVATGELEVGARTVSAGAAVDELAPMAPRPLPAPVVARLPTRVVRVARVDFEELVDDEPGLAALLLRALGERLRAPAVERRG
ncbi:MAG: cyclic nucleotide-binding domain-containing protein [Myxococcales bacterium]|nr:cyclic nucleotide-binding domain-containing protein [Myxococcales bacterium]